MMIMMISRRACFQRRTVIALHARSVNHRSLKSTSRQAEGRIKCPYLLTRTSSLLPSASAPGMLHDDHRKRLDNMQKRQQQQLYSTRSRTTMPERKRFPAVVTSPDSDDDKDIVNDDDDDDENNKVRSEMRQAAMTLLDEETFPEGELLYDAWMDAQDEILPYWLQQEDASVESVDIVFRVLNRLALEQTAFPTLTRCQWIDVDLMERVVHHWFVVHKQQGPTSTFLQEQYTPQQVLQKVEHLCSAFHQASWSTVMAYYLVVAELRPHEGRNAVFCEGVLNKTLDRFQEELEDEEKVTEEAKSRPSARLFDAVISAWTHVAVSNAQRSRLLSDNVHDNDAHGKNNKKNKNNGAAAVVLEAAQKVDALLQLMKRMGVRPTPRAPAFVTAMHAWSRTNSLRGALRVQELLEQMHRHVTTAHDDDNDNHMDDDDMVDEDYYNMEDGTRERRGAGTWPWIDAFICAIRAWAWSKDGRAGMQAEKLLQKFHDYYDDGIITLNEYDHDHAGNVHGDVVNDNNHNVVGVYNTAFLCYALLGTPRAARQAQELFMQMKIHHHHHQPSKGPSSNSTLINFVEPNAETYYWVTAAMANGGFVAESEAIASDLVAAYTASQHSSSSSPSHVVKPLREMFHAIIIGWSRSRDRNRIQRARAIVTAMENRRHNEYDDQEEESHDNDLSPTVATYNAYLSCLSKRRGPASIQNAKEAVSVLEKMRFMSNPSLQERQRRDNLRPNCQTYSHVIHCWANCGSANMAERYFQAMIDDFKDGNETARPNTAAVNMVLLAYSKSGDPQAPDRAEAFFRKFLLSSEQEQEEQQLDLQPDLYSFSTLLHCLSKRRKDRKPVSETAQAVEDVFREMQQRYRKGGDSQGNSNANLLRPNQVMYNVVINCWAQARNPAKAEQVFEEMYQDFTQGNNPNAEPNVRSLNSVMKAWAISGRTDSAERAEKILELMRDLHVNGILTDIQPTCVTYTTLLMSYALKPGSSGTATQRADAIVEEMWKLYNANLLDEAPNEVTYKNLLQVWDKSKEVNKAERIRAIHEEMRIVFGKERHDETFVKGQGDSP